MALLEEVRRQPTPADGAFRIRMFMRQSVVQMEQNLRMVGQIIQRHGKANIEQALGADAAELATLYSKLKKALKDIDPGRDVPDLPTK